MMESVPDRQPASRAFVWLALTTALLTVGLIVFGAIVRVTDSGLGCGSSWPLCNGTIFPPLDNITAWIEWLHRLFAALIGLFGLITLFVAIKVYHRNDRIVLGYTVAAALLFAVQSILGAMVVVLELPPTFVTLHLGVAMLLLGALLVAGVASRYQPRSMERDTVSTLIYLNTALALVIILTGALVRGAGAMLACTDYPLCMNGELLPLDIGQLAVIHMAHRFAVAALGLTLLILVWQIVRARQMPLIRGLAFAALIAYFAQAGVGAMYVLSRAEALWGAAHVGLAATTWALLVILSTIEALNTRQSVTLRETGTQWKTQSSAAS